MTRAERILTAVSLALAVAAAVTVLVIPSYSGTMTATDPVTGQVKVVHARATLLEVNGTRVIVPVLFPVAVALAAWLFRHRAVRFAAALVLWGFAILAGFTIGLFYIPSAAAMLGAAAAGIDRS